MSVIPISSRVTLLAMPNFGSVQGFEVLRSPDLNKYLGCFDFSGVNVPKILAVKRNLYSYATKRLLLV